MTTAPIKVLLYEDNTDLRHALVALICGTEGFEITGSHASCDRVLEHVEMKRPDVVIFDIDLIGGKSGIEGVAILKNKYPKVEAMMLTVFDDDDRVFEAICAGANGYLLKKTPPAKLLEAIREISDGGAPMTPVVARKVLQLFPKKSASTNEDVDKLTARELEVLNWMAKGFSYKMVAAELGITLETVRTHVKRIYQKLHVHSAAEAIAKVYLNKT